MRRRLDERRKESLENARSAQENIDIRSEKSRFARDIALCQ
jgi:hypothetical protein